MSSLQAMQIVNFIATFTTRHFQTFPKHKHVIKRANAN